MDIEQHARLEAQLDDVTPLPKTSVDRAFSIVICRGLQIDHIGFQRKVDRTRPIFPGRLRARQLRLISMTSSWSIISPPLSSSFVHRRCKQRAHSQLTAYIGRPKAR